MCRAMNGAHWMIQAIDQRRQTMLTEMNFIVDRQHEFFEEGVEYLKPLKFFFSSGLSTATGEDASARSIKAPIEKLVADETTESPLTDQQIVELFDQTGVKIARRTVTKYRDQPEILPARMRKRI